MNLQENIYRIKEVMGVISEQTLPAEIRRRIAVGDIEKIIDKRKKFSFTPDKSIENSVIKTLIRVSDDLLEVFPYDGNEYEKYSESIRKALYDIYGPELREYFEKRKERYENMGPSDVRYIFKKDYKGQGFSEGFPSFDDLLNKYGSWVDVDWEEVENKLKEMNDYHDESFSKWKYTRPLLISKAGDKGNRWGYNFYIIKSKEKS